MDAKKKINAIEINQTNKNEYSVTAQVFHTTKNNDQKQETTPTTFTATGKNITEAISTISLKSPKSLYLGHLELVIVNEAFAKDDIGKMTDYFLRNTNISKNFSVFISKNEEGTDPNTSILEKNTSTSIVSASTLQSEFIDFLKDFTSEGKEVVLPTISVMKDRFLIENVAVLKGKQLVGYLNEAENIGYHFITNKIKNTNINYPCGKDEYIGVTITNSETKMHSKIKDETPTIYIRIRSNAEITEVNCTNGIEDLTKVRKKTEQRIKDHVNKVIDKTKTELNSDIFGFGKNIYQNHYRYWQTIKDQWDQYRYGKIKVITDVEVILNNQGSILETVR